MDKLADTFGRKKVYTIGYILVTAFAVICGSAPNVGILIRRALYRMALGSL